MSNNRLAHGTNKAALKARLQALLLQSQNQRCSECDEPRPTWASLLQHHDDDESNVLGVFCCFSCSTQLYKLGPSLCTVKSVKMMDDWTEQEVVAMEQGDNTTINRIYEATLSHDEYDRVKDPDLSQPERLEFLQHKYASQRYLDAHQYHCWVLHVQQRHAQRDFPRPSVPRRNPSFHTANHTNSGMDLGMRRPTRQRSVQRINANDDDDDSEFGNSSSYMSSDYATSSNHSTSNNYMDLYDDVSSLGASSYQSGMSYQSYQRTPTTQSPPTQSPPTADELGYGDDEQDLGYGQDEDYTEMNDASNQDVLSVASSVSYASSEHSSYSANNNNNSNNNMSMDLDLGYEDVVEEQDDDEPPRPRMVSDPVDNTSLHLLDLGYGDTSDAHGGLGYEDTTSYHLQQPPQQPATTSPHDDVPSAPELGYEWEQPAPTTTNNVTATDLGYGDDKQSNPPKPSHRIRARLRNSRCSMPTLGESTENMRRQASTTRVPDVRGMPRRTSSAEGPGMFPQAKKPAPRMRRASVSCGVTLDNNYKQQQPLAPLPKGIFKPATRRMRRLSISLVNEGGEASNSQLNHSSSLLTSTTNNTYNNKLPASKPVYVGQEPIIKKTRRMLRRSSTTGNATMGGNAKKSSLSKNGRHRLRRSSTGGAPSDWKGHSTDLTPNAAVSRWQHEPRMSTTGVSSNSSSASRESSNASPPRRGPPRRSSTKPTADPAPRRRGSNDRGSAGLVMPLRQGSLRDIEFEKPCMIMPVRQRSIDAQDEYKEQVTQQDAAPASPARLVSRDRSGSLDPVEEGDERRQHAKGPPPRGCRFAGRGCSTGMPAMPTRSSSEREICLEDDGDKPAKGGLMATKSMTRIELRKDSSPRSSATNIYTPKDRVHRPGGLTMALGCTNHHDRQEQQQSLEDALGYGRDDWRNEQVPRSSDFRNKRRHEKPMHTGGVLGVAGLA